MKESPCALLEREEPPGAKVQTTLLDAYLMTGEMGMLRCSGIFFR